MRTVLTLFVLSMLAGCSSSGSYYSTYDVNRDGVMDFVCPGMEYDPSKHTVYSLRSQGSQQCREQG